jgi:hypothetical protein
MSLQNARVLIAGALMPPVERELVRADSHATADTGRGSLEGGSLDVSIRECAVVAPLLACENVESQPAAREREHAASCQALVGASRSQAQIAVKL